MNFSNAVFERSFGEPGQLISSTCPEIVFSGRSNVGKSSLINRITGRKSLARVSARPGKTGTINFYKLDSVRLVDLPGYGYAAVSQSEKRRWAELVERYFNSDRDIALVVQIIDMRHPPTADDLGMINYMMTRGMRFVIVLAKSDKLNRTQREQRFASLAQEVPHGDFRFVVFSSVSGEGVEELRNMIKSMGKNL